jgi:hypothetical protein
LSVASTTRPVDAFTVCLVVLASLMLAPVALMNGVLFAVPLKASVLSDEDR